MTYARFMRGLGWVMLAVSFLALLLGVVAAFAFANTYGWAGWGASYRVSSRSWSSPPCLQWLAGWS